MWLDTLRRRSASSANVLRAPSVRERGREHKGRREGGREGGREHKGRRERERERERESDH